MSSTRFGRHFGSYFQDPEAHFTFSHPDWTRPRLLSSVTWTIIGLRVADAFDYEGLHNLLLMTTNLEHELIGEKSDQEEEQDGYQIIQVMLHPVRVATGRAENSYEDV